MIRLEPFFLNRFRSLAIAIVFNAVCIFSMSAQDLASIEDSLTVHFEGNGSIEVGGHYVGLEFHKSSPLAQRISFFYPAANSIDLSNDYWTRDKNHSMIFGLKIGEAEQEWIGLDAYEYSLTPYKVSFHKKDQRKEVNITYQFSKNSPAFIVTYDIQNNTDKTEVFEFYTDIEASVKTSHSYITKDKAWGEYKEEGAALFINYDDPETKNVQLFSANAGLMPVAYSSLSALDSLPAKDVWWSASDWNLQNGHASRENPQTSAFRYVYNKTLAPGESMKIVQIVGSARQGEGYEMVGKLLQDYEKEIQSYENGILKDISEKPFQTGNTVLDHSVLWSHGILNANMHYIDDSIVPMPCPAQYNFYFTHDVLLTDLSAVNYDLPRVKADLEFIIQHADSNKVIPHAYYWKDSKYHTEIAPPDNWNHFWFVITSAKYLRHSGDEEFAEKLYPYIEKSVEYFLRNKKNDVIYSYRPDWWDIAWNFGPRSYTTLLATYSLREFIFISSRLEKNSDRIENWALQANNMQDGLNETLWDEETKYLMNYYEDGSQDPHYYIGSLLGSHYNVLDETREKELVTTAEHKIVDSDIGVYTVYPMDFHTLKEYLKLNGNEAGDPYYYLNGGIWPHGNAWYSLALIEAGQKEKAFQFIRDVMTVKGIMDSPNGYPAMYEYRVSKKSDPAVYGKIDKPQFTWAAGWYLYSLYNLYGVKENNWNISLDPYLPKDHDKVHFMLAAGGYNLKVDISGEGNHVREILFDGQPQYSTVLPYRFDQKVENIEIRKGVLLSPLLTNLDGILNDVTYDATAKEMTIQISSFEGHKVSAIIKTPFRVNEVHVLDRDTEVDWQIKEVANNYELSVEFLQESESERLLISFDK